MPRFSRYHQLKQPGVASTSEGAAPAFWTVENETPGQVGRLTIHYRDPQKADGKQDIDVSGWLRWPELYAQFCTACVRQCAMQGALTRREFHKDLGRGWFAFLESSNRFDLDLEAIDKGLAQEFILWLNQSQLSDATRVSRFGVFRSVMRQLQREPTISARVAADFYAISGPWSQLNKRRTPTKVIQNDAWVGLYRACIAEVNDTIARVESDWALIEQTRPKLAGFRPSSQGSYRDLGTCLSEIDRTFPCVVPARPEIFALNSHLDNAIVTYHSYTRVALPFHPRPRLLVPFVLALGMQFHANSSLLLGAELKDFRSGELLGKPRIIWKRWKPRAKSTQARSYPATEDDDNPQTLLRFLGKWTWRIRKVAKVEERDRLFLFVPEWGEGKRCMSFDVRSSGACAWSSNLKRFLKVHKLDHLNLRMLRASGLDQLRHLDVDDDPRLAGLDGDAAVAAGGGQKSSSVIREHYTSPGAHASAQEQIGGVVELRARYIGTLGKADPRKVPREADRAAATPGWYCLDPFESPIPGQQRGRLCHAYGACPVCPLARMDFASGYCCARTLQLKRAVSNAMTSVPPARWIAVWRPVMEALEAIWLPRFNSKQVLKEASELDLDPLPNLE